MLCVLCWFEAQSQPLPKQLVWQGNRLYDTATLESLIQEEWRNYSQTQQLSYVDDAAYVILSHYRRRGHYFASVDYEIDGPKVTMYIQEYNPVVVKETQIVHAQDASKPLSFSQERLRKFLTPPPMLEQPYFNQLQILEDKGAVDTFYLSEGFLQESSQLHYRFSPDVPESTSVSIALAIDEGPRFYLEELEFSGNRRFGSGELQNVLKFNESIVYRPRLHQDFVECLRTFYREQGYARVKVKADVQSSKAPKTPQRHGRKIVFTIEEQKQNYIRHISVVGNELTDQEIILRQLDIREKDLYNLAKIQSSKQNLNNTKLFITMDIEEKLVDDDQVDLVVSVEERNFQSVTFNLGYATTYGVTGGIVYENINLGGTFRQFLFNMESTIVAAELSKSEASLQLTEPQLFGSRIWSGYLRGFVLYEETPTYDVLERGASIVAEHRFTSFLSAQFGYNLIWSQILKIKAGAEDEEEGTTFLATLQTKWILNLRDSDSYPTSGCYNFIQLESSLTALGAEIDYCKVYLHSAWYFCLVDRCVLGLAVRGGVISPFGTTENIPIQKRYFSGGVDSVRSFKTKELPPLNGKDNPSGGEGLFLFSAELRIPVYRGLGFSLFGDSGQIMPHVRSWNDYRISHLKYGVGFSIWYTTPIGPIRFDMGFNPDREENPLTGNEERLFAWFISIGFSY